MIDLDMLRQRHSVRSYGAEPISAPLIESLKAEATFVETHEAGIRFRLTFGSGAPLCGFTNSYGFFSGVDNYLVAIVDPTFQDTYERAGFYGEEFVMKAVEAGLGTCFVSGTYSEKDIEVAKEVYEKIAFLIPFGYKKGKDSLLARMGAAMTHRKKMTGLDFFEGSDEDYKMAQRLVPGLAEGLEAIACAPSAMNRRGVRLRLADAGAEGSTAGAAGEENLQLIATIPDPTDTNYLIDLGIAKYNFSAVVPGTWLWGSSAPFLPA